MASNWLFLSETWRRRTKNKMKNNKAKLEDIFGIFKNSKGLLKKLREKAWSKRTNKKNKK